MPGPIYDVLAQMHGASGDHLEILLSRRNCATIPHEPFTYLFKVGSEFGIFRALMTEEGGVTMPIKFKFMSALVAEPAKLVDAVDIVVSEGFDVALEQGEMVLRDAWEGKLQWKAGRVRKLRLQKASGIRGPVSWKAPSRPQRLRKWLRMLCPRALVYYWTYLR